MAELLVTGGAGFVGSNFVRFWADRHPEDEITVLDALTYAGSRANLTGVAGVRFVEGDICDTRLVRELLESGIDTVVHFAAETHVDRSISGPDAFIETNILGTHSLLKAARAAWLEAGPKAGHRFHYVSTDEVYGSLADDELPFSEAGRYAPSSPYSASKAAGEHLVSAYHRTFGLGTSVTNGSNSYGPWQHPDKLIPLFLINALLGRALPLYGDGLHVRDWLHVEDHCRAIELALLQGRDGETFNVGGGQGLPNRTVVDLICTMVDAAFRDRPALASRFPHAPAAQGRATETLVDHVADRPGHDRRYAIDTGKIRQELGFSPAWSFEAGLASTIGWYIENESWWIGRVAPGAFLRRQTMSSEAPSVDMS